jgi:hypothetical protein
VRQTDRDEKKMRGDVFSKNICGGERRNENIIVSGTLKTKEACTIIIILNYN